MPTLKLFDHNGRPQKEDEWHRFDSLLADIIQNAVVHHETEDSDDEINSFMQQMQWQQLLPGIACITLQDDQLLNDSDFRDILGSAIQECISKKITNGRLARESLSRHCAKSAANLPPLWPHDKGGPRREMLRGHARKQGSVCRTQALGPPIIGPPGTSDLGSSRN